MQNKHNLSRTINSETKRQIRKECGFGCIICGFSIYVYHHIDPEFDEAISHDVDKIGLLCGKHHDMVHRGIYPTQFIKKMRLNPYCICNPSQYDYCIDPLSDIMIKVGNLSFINTKSIIHIDDVNILSINVPEEVGSPPIISAQFYDRNGLKVGWIENNEWYGNSSAFDIDTKGSKIIIRSKLHSIDLELILSHPNIISIEKINMFFNGTSIVGTKDTGFKIETQNSSISTGKNEIIYKNSPFGINIQGHKIMFGSPKVITTKNKEGAEIDLGGYYEVKNGKVHLDYSNSEIPKVSLSFVQKNSVCNIVVPKVLFPNAKLTVNNKQDDDSICDCRSNLKYKDCCKIFYHKIESLENHPSLYKLLQQIFSNYEVNQIQYKCSYLPKIHAETLLLSPFETPIILINTSKTLAECNLGYSLLLWKLINDDYIYLTDVYTTFKNQIFVNLQDLLISFPILELLKTKKFEILKIKDLETKFIKSELENKLQTESDFNLKTNSFLYVSNE